MRPFSIVFGALLACWLTAVTAAETAPKIQLPAYSTVKLDNGMTLLLMERHQLPLVSFRWYLPSAGALCDPQGKEGLAMITAQLLRKGTTQRSAVQLAQDIDYVGGSLGIGASEEFAVGDAEFVEKDFATALELLAETLCHPVFAKEELDKMLQQEIDGIKQAKEVPGEVIGQYFRSFLFGSHPYARPAGGTETTLATITREDVVGFYDRHYTPERLVLAVVGDFSTAEAASAIKQRFAEWKSKSVSLPAVQVPEPCHGRQVLLVDKPDATQAFFRIGNVSIARTNVDWIPVQVINTLFGGRFTSMLNSRLRIESGLTYHAGTTFEARPLPGAFSMYFYTRNETCERAVKLALDVLRDLHDKGITDEQLKSAQAYIRGQFGPTLETNDQLADILCDLHFYGLGPDYINTYLDRVDAMTLSDARRVIDKYYPVADLRFAIVGQKSVIEPTAATLSSEISRKSILDVGF